MIKLGSVILAVAAWLFLMADFAVEGVTLGHGPGPFAWSAGVLCLVAAVMVVFTESRR